MRKLFSGFLVALGLISISAMSAPTVQVKGGQTSVEISEGLIEALAECQVDRIKPGQVKPGGERLRLPVAGGAIDLDSLHGEVEHRGGITMSCSGGENKVSLENFRLESLPIDAVTPGVPVVTTLASVNDSVLGRIAFLTPGGEDFEVVVKGGTVQLRQAALVLTADAEDFLLANLGLDLSALDVIGESSSRLNVRMEKSADDDSPGNGLAKGKDKEKPQNKSDDDDDEVEED